MHPHTQIVHQLNCCRSLLPGQNNIASDDFQLMYEIHALFRYRGIRVLSSRHQTRCSTSSWESWADSSSWSLSSPSLWCALAEGKKGDLNTWSGLSISKWGRTAWCWWRQILASPCSYKRKLKASKAFNSAMDLKQQDGPVVPGTNKFSKEGSGDKTFNNHYFFKRRIYFWRGCFFVLFFFTCLQD